MPLDIADAEDAFLSALTDWDEFIQDFETDWFRPLLQTQFLAFMRALTDGQRRWLERNLPEQYRQLKELKRDLEAENG